MTLPAFGVLLVWIGTLFLPGAAVAAAAGLRPWPAVATAPLLTYGLATVSGTLATVVQLTWGPWFLVAVTAGTSAGLRLLQVRGPGRRQRTGRARPVSGWTGRPTRRDLAMACGIGLGGLVSMGVLLAGFGHVDRPNQDWDYTFHANATRFIADNGDVAPAALRAVNDWGSPSFFYPNAYHAVAAVVRDMTGAPVFTVLNVHTSLVCGIAGLGLAVLLGKLGSPTAVAVATPVLLAGFAAFPYDVLWRGPLLPYAAGLAATPAFLVLVLTVVDERRPAIVVVAALAGAALFGLQPSTALSGGFLAVLLVAQRWAGRRRVDGRELALLGVSALLVAVLAAPEVRGALATSTGGPTVDWPAVETAPEAAWALLSLSHGTAAPQVVLALFLVAGLITLRSASQLWWLTAGGVLAGGLFVLAASSDGRLAELLTRPWWNDRWRLAALAVLVLAPVAAHGAWRLCLAAAAAGGRVHSRLRRPAVPYRSARVVPATVLVLASLLTAAGYARANSQQVAAVHQTDRHLDDAEVAAMAWLAPRVGPRETVMNDPGDGSAYMWALEGIRPVFGHEVPPAAYAVMEPARKTLLDRFTCLDTDPRVRQDITDLRIGYVFLGTGFVRQGMGRIQGLVGLAFSRSLELVYARDGVRIYQVHLQSLSDRPVAGCTAPSEPPG